MARTKTIRRTPIDKKIVDKAIALITANANEKIMQTRESAERMIGILRDVGAGEMTDREIGEKWGLSENSVRTYATTHGLMRSDFKGGSRPGRPGLSPEQWLTEFNTGDPYDEIAQRLGVTYLYVRRMAQIYGVYDEAKSKRAVNARQKEERLRTIRQNAENLREARRLERQKLAQELVVMQRETRKAMDERLRGNGDSPWADLRSAAGARINSGYRHRARIACEMRYKGATLEEIAEIFHITRERVRQIIKNSLIGAYGDIWEGKTPPTWWDNGELAVQMRL